jgi:hypothetical protein
MPNDLAMQWLKQERFGEQRWVKYNFEKIVIGLILVTTLPVLFKTFFHKGKEG